MDYCKYSLKDYVLNNNLTKDLTLDENGYINVDSEYKTKIKGIYAAGDVVKKEAFQIVTSVSDGALAAVSAIKDIKD